eukprot:scaffold71237_cov30-Tisochrysis_lutea.AAC.6
MGRWRREEEKRKDAERGEKRVGGAVEGRGDAALVTRNYELHAGRVHHLTTLGRPRCPLLLARGILGRRGR